MTWLTGWAWTVSGVVLGALIAPMLSMWAGLSNTRYQDWFVIAVALLAGFIVQFLGFCVWGVGSAAYQVDWMPKSADVTFIVVSSALPIAIVGYGLYRYLTWVGAGQRTVTVAFVGGLLVKTFAIPFFKNVVWGSALAAVIRWLRGDKAKPA